MGLRVPHGVVCKPQIQLLLYIGFAKFTDFFSWKSFILNLFWEYMLDIEFYSVIIFVTTSEMLFYKLLACIVSDGQYAVIFIFAYLTQFVFFLWLLLRFSPSHWFLATSLLCYFCSLFILLGIELAL